MSRCAFGILSTSLRRLSFAVTAACLLLPVALAQPPNPLTDWKSASYPNTFSKARSFPVIQNGYLISFKATLPSGAASDAVLLTSMSTGQVTILAFAIPGASIVWIADVSVLSNQVYVVGSYESPTDAIDHNFVATLRTGAAPVIQDLMDYEPVRVCASTSGSLWMAGQIWSLEGKGNGYDMIRQYSASGTLTHSYAPRSSLRVAEVDLSLRTHHPGSLRARTFLECGVASVGLLIGSIVHTWTEIDPVNGTVQTWKYQPVTNLQAAVTGMALLATHNVYSSVETFDTAGTVLSSGLYKLDLQVRPAVWQPAAVTGVLRTLLGADNSTSSLVYLRRQNPGAIPVAYWSRP